MSVLLWMLAAHAFDMTTTAIGLSAGFSETNAVGRALIGAGWPMVVAIDTALIVALWAFLGRLAAPVSLWGRRLAAAMLAVPAILNLGVLLR